jgi:phospholipase C
MTGDEPLGQIEHIVVLMMENRSFDHMLGYLKHDGMPDVNGFEQGAVNRGPDGTPYPVFEFPSDQTAFHKPGQLFDKSLDPCHAPDCVRDQLSDDNGGFVRNFIEKKNPPPDKRGLVMGHYTAAHLPVYDFLARNYCVCDAWHSSIPGDTWPNRLYAVAGQAGPPVVPRLSLYQSLKKLLGRLPALSKLGGAPIYDVPAFTRHLADNQWRWYAHDPAMLRGADSRYRDFKRLNRDNFAYFDRKKVSFLTEDIEYLVVGDGSSFLDEAATGLRNVSWIDPNFIDVHILDPSSNDDHPPSDVLAGQALVLDIYDALTKSPGWEKTLLVVVYDEHGGFYDHVAPPRVDDGSGYPTYGVRVPALLVGPRVKKFVCHEFFDHTTLIKTILKRFAADPASATSAMGRRVEHAADLDVVLQADVRTDIPGHDHLHNALDAWRAKSRAERRLAASPSRAPDGAGHPLVPTDLQGDFAAFAAAMHIYGLPSGQP